MIRRTWLQGYARDKIKSLGEICVHFVSCADGFIRIPDLLRFFFQLSENFLLVQAVLVEVVDDEPCKPCCVEPAWSGFSGYSNDGQATLEIIDVFREAIHKIIIIIIIIITILFNFENMYIIYSNTWSKNLKALYNLTNHVSHKNTIKTTT